MRDLPLVGDEFAGYRPLAVLGRGGMSTVYRAENPRVGNVIALKVMASELAGDDVFRGRFLEESRIAAGLNHPNVIPIYDWGVQRPAALHRHAPRDGNRPAADAQEAWAAADGNGGLPASVTVGVTG